MNQFDEFIDEADKKLNIDTSEQISGTPTKETHEDLLSKDSSLLSSPKSPIISNTSKFNLQRQITPTRIEDHPLKDSELPKGAGLGIEQFPVKHNSEPTTVKKPIDAVPSLRSKIPKRRSVMLNKRRSLIQPVMAPISPESFVTKTGTVTIDDNFSKADDNIPVRKYSVGNSNIIDPEHVQLSQVHSRSSSLASGSATLDSNDINLLLKNLASKEMDLFESKQKIEDLKKKLSIQQKLYDQHAKELQQLKSQVTKHLSENVNSVNNSMTSPVIPQLPQQPVTAAPVATDRPTAVIPQISTSNELASPEPKETIQSENRGQLHRRGTRTLRPKKNATPNKIREIPVSSPDSVIMTKQPTKQQDESGWNKTFSMFNQFDQILQSELEKSLNWDSETDNSSPEKIDRKDGANVFNPGLPQSRSVTPIPSILKEDDSEPNPSLTKSLWSFVDSVRSGLLGIDEDEENEISSETASSYNTRDLPANTNMKQFKTAQKSQGNKLQFIDDTKDTNNESVRRNVEMRDF